MCIQMSTRGPVVIIVPVFVVSFVHLVPSHARVWGLVMQQADDRAVRERKELAWRRSKHNIPFLPRGWGRWPNSLTAKKSFAR
jgi:hypothetical protein